MSLLSCWRKLIVSKSPIYSCNLMWISSITAQVSVTLDNLTHCKGIHQKSLDNTHNCTIQCTGKTQEIVQDSATVWHNSLCRVNVKHSSMNGKTVNTTWKMQRIRRIWFNTKTADYFLFFSVPIASLIQHFLYQSFCKCEVFLWWTVHIYLY